jgi:hypothetical protein
MLHTYIHSSESAKALYSFHNFIDVYVKDCKHTDIAANPKYPFKYKNLPKVLGLNTFDFDNIYKLRLRTLIHSCTTHNFASLL